MNVKRSRKAFNFELIEIKGKEKASYTQLKVTLKIKQETNKSFYSEPKVNVKEEKEKEKDLLQTKSERQKKEKERK